MSDFYAGELVHNGFTTAGALDTHCIDKESSLPLLNGGLMLFEVTGQARYLDLAEQAAYYLATWQWHHAVPYPEHSALHTLGYDTFGGTSVSVQHHHHDPYGLAFVNGWLQLGNLTGKEVWKQRALTAWSSGTVGISDGTPVAMGKQRPVGSQDEGFFHTRWGDPFNVSQWLVAWPTAFRLAVLRQQPDWSILSPGTQSYRRSVGR